MAAKANAAKTTIDRGRRERGQSAGSHFPWGRSSRLSAQVTICGWKLPKTPQSAASVMNAPPDLVFEDFSGCVIVRVSGRAMIDDNGVTMLTIAENIRARSPKAVLVDLRNLSGPLTFMDRYQLGAFAGKHLIGFHLSVLAHEEQTDEQRIGLLVARNRGARIEAMFTDEASALSWLEQYTRA